VNHKKATRLTTDGLRDNPELILHAELYYQLQLIFH